MPLAIHDIVKVLLILGIGVIVAGVMISSIVLGDQLKKKLFTP
jgi:hypothetical protein